MSKEETKQKKKQPTYLSNPYESLPDFIDNVTQNYRIRKVDVRRMTELWCKIRGIPVPRGTYKKINDSWASLLHVDIRNSKYAERDAEDNVPPYVSSISGLISAMIPNEVTNAAWKNIKRGEFRGIGARDIFAGASGWVDRQLASREGRAVQRAGKSVGIYNFLQKKSPLGKSDEGS